MRAYQVLQSSNGKSMKAKMFQLAAQAQLSGRSSATTFEEHLKEFLARHVRLRLVPTHTTTLSAESPSNATWTPKEPSIIIFYTPFRVPTWDSTPPENMNCEG